MEEKNIKYNSTIDNIIADVVENGYRTILIKATGIPKKCIMYEKEFMNKTRAMCLHIYGSTKRLEKYGIIAKINETIFVDTAIYNKYSVKIADGVIVLTLFEKINPRPELTDISDAY